MNIVMYTNSFLPKIGGRELVVHQLSRALVRLGHRVRVLGPAGWLRQRSANPPEYPVHRWPLPRGRWREPGALQALRLDLKFWGADVVHVHNTYPNGYRMARLENRRLTPYIVTPHGEDIHRIPALDYGLRLQPEVDERIRVGLEHAAFTTAISDGIKQSLLDARVAEERIVMIPNGVDVDRFAHRPEADAARLWPQFRERRLIVSVGNYHPRKGHELLLRAFARVRRAVPDAALAIVGRRLDGLLPLARELGVEQHMWTGPLPLPAADAPDQLAALLHMASVYVCASIDAQAEGLSLALLEGMAAGLPAVATRISGNTDVVFHQENGLLIPPNDETAMAEAIAALLRDPEAQTRMGRAAGATAARFSWMAIARRYAEVYQSAIDAYSPGVRV